jgi:hypothetical protein
MDYLTPPNAVASPSDIQNWHQGTFRLFLILIFTVTLIPMVLIGVLGHLHLHTLSIDTFAILVASAAGPGHVGLTSFFYADKEMQTFFKGRPLRYVVIPIACAIAMGLYWQFLPAVYTANLLGLFFIWQTYHYQKQNYGILCFFNAATGGPPITRLEKVIVDLSAVAGILGLFQRSNLFNGTLVVPYMPFLYQTGLYLNCAVLAILVVAIATVPAIRNNRLRSVFLVICALFYLPTFVVDDPGAAIASYAYAHGLQYYVFMYFVAASHRRHQNDNRIVLMISAAISGVTILTLFADRTIWGGIGGFIFGVYLSIVMSHFVIDAGIWKVRGDFQRRYMKTAFPFIFQPRPRPEGKMDPGGDRDLSPGQDP